MKLPQKFQLLAHQWTVEPVKGSFMEGEDLCNGVCDFSSLTIKVNVDLPESLVVHSFLHEVMHAVLWSLGHPLATDEGFVDSVGCALAQVMSSAEGLAKVKPNGVESALST